MKRLLAAIAFAAALPALAQQPAVQPTELRFASPAPPVSLVTQGFAAWAKEVEAASGGTISVRVMAGPSLATFENVYDRVLKGVADLGWGTSNDVGGQFKKTL